MKARDTFLKSHPFCVVCHRPAGVVDHIISIYKRPDLRLDPENLQAMCESCHNRKTATEDGGFTGKG